MTTSQDVAEYLNGLELTRATPVLVTIGRTTYAGAHYVQVRNVPEGTRAHAEGKRIYRQSGYYLLGELPASYRHRNADAYVDRASGQRFYVASYFPPLDEPELRNEWHPFGPMFQLFPGAADVPVERTMPMSVEF